jgi:hypothetical protein
MDVFCFSKLLASSNESSQCQNPEEQLLHTSSHENFKPHKYDSLPQLTLEDHVDTAVNIAFSLLGNFVKNGSSVHHAASLGYI